MLGKKPVCACGQELWVTLLASLQSPVPSPGAMSLNVPNKKPCPPGTDAGAIGGVVLISVLSYRE